MERPKDVNPLADIKQKDNEYLRSYIALFNVIVAVVRKPYPTIVHMAIFLGAREETRFYDSLMKTKTKNLKDFYKRERNIPGWRNQSLT